ncbi:MAG: neutral/alkaline non-lysosomal ceramidase N-terminal domain-containing protein [Limisphaerales bacterium]
MKVGTAQIDITPKPGVDLSGFAVRPQPSTGVLDLLWIRALYFENDTEKLLWLHADLLALDQKLADRLRQRIQIESGIPFSRILLSTTHTHSAPATIQLTSCGEIAPAYVAWLEEQFIHAAKFALQNPEPCSLVAVEGRCELGMDRRRSATPHTDPRVGALGWKRADGTFKAVFLCYSMHPVCLRGSQISGDWTGETARAFFDVLPGRPVVFVSSGACGNIDPPKTGVTPEQMRHWGQQIAESVSDKLLTQAEMVSDDSLKFNSIVISLPKDGWSVEQIEKHAASCLAHPASRREFGSCLTRAAETWKRNMLDQLRQGESSVIRAELGMIIIGPFVIITVNGEIFSHFTELINSKDGCSVYAVGCVNGMVGYIPSADAYADNGYEVLWSMLFYNLPRLRKGGLEILAQHANQLLAVSNAAPRPKI